MPLMRPAELATIYRYEVPVDDRDHEHVLSGPVLHVACRRPALVEFWARHDAGAAPVPRRFRAVGTGHWWPAGATYHGTDLDGDLVWHLIEVPA